MLMSLKSANGCSSSIMHDIDCFMGFQGCDRNLAYENLRHYDEDSGEYDIATQTCQFEKK